MYFMTFYFSSVSLLLLSLIIFSYSYQCWFMGCLITNVYFNKCQEETSETGINRRYKNSCLPWKKTHFGFLNLTELSNKQQNNKTNTTYSLTITTVFYVPDINLVVFLVVDVLGVGRLSMRLLASAFGPTTVLDRLVIVGGLWVGICLLVMGIVSLAVIARCETFHFVKLLNLFESYRALDTLEISE